MVARFAAHNHENGGSADPAMPPFDLLKIWTSVS
jgi:hypothetical protein